MATLKNGEFIDDVLEYYESTESERTGSPVDKEIKLMKSKLSIDDLISKYVSLEISRIDIEEKTGDCPFTDCTGVGGKTGSYIKNQVNGSFVVNRVNGMFYCFDCDESGDHIIFMAKKAKLTLKDAFNFIITKYNLDIPYKN